MPKYKILDVKINYSSIRDKISKSDPFIKRGWIVAKRKADEFFLPKKRKMISDFLNNPISIEIKDGPSGSNLSGVLSGYGNLFSFIGFEKGSDPIEDLRRGISLLTQLRKKKYEKLNWVFTVKIPDLNSLIPYSQMPWQAGASWAIEIEKGLSGLQNYLNRKRGFSGSRSGTGIQTKNVIREVSANRKKYLSKIFNDFVRDFR